MRCNFLSDLHLEAQSIEASLAGGDVLIVAGDLCQAKCLDASRSDRYAIEQRSRVLRFVEQAAARYAHILLIAGNHEHYDGVFEETVPLLRRHLPMVTVLDDEATEIGGMRFFGSTLWTDFEGRSQVSLDGVRRRMGEYFFVKTLNPSDGTMTKFQPERALQAHDAALAALRRELDRPVPSPLVVVTHHAPSLLGLDRKHAGNGLDGAYASRLDAVIESLANVPVWVHGHTHVARSYRIGTTMVRSNALGFASRGHAAPGFSMKAAFDV